MPLKLAEQRKPRRVDTSTFHRRRDSPPAHLTPALSVSRAVPAQALPGIGRPPKSARRLPWLCEALVRIALASSPWLPLSRPRPSARMATGRHSATWLYRFSLGLGGRQRDERVRWFCQSSTLPAPQVCPCRHGAHTRSGGRVPDVVSPAPPTPSVPCSGIKLLRIEFLFFQSSVWRPLSPKNNYVTLLLKYLKTCPSKGFNI